VKDLPLFEPSLILKKKDRLFFKCRPRRGWAPGEDRPRSERQCERGVDLWKKGDGRRSIRGNAVLRGEGGGTDRSNKWEQPGIRLTSGRNTGTQSVGTEKKRGARTCPHSARRCRGSCWGEGFLRRGLKELRGGTLKKKPRQVGARSRGDICQGSLRGKRTPEGSQILNNS